MNQGPSFVSVAPTKVRHWVLLWLCGAMATAYVARNSIAAAESTLRADLNLTKLESGWLMSGFFLSYALCQIPTAGIGRRFGARAVLPLFAAAWSIASAAMALLSGFYSLMLTRVIQGVAQAGLIPTCVASVSRWTPQTGRAFASGSLGSFMSIGGALGIWFTGVALDSINGWGWNWRTVFVACALPSVAWAIGFWFWFRDEPRAHSSVNRAEVELIELGMNQSKTSEGTVSGPQGGFPTPWVLILTSPPLWWICGQQLCRAAGYTFFTSWFATYLQETRQIGIARSGFLNMLPLLGVVLGGLVGGVISDWLLRTTGRRSIARKWFSAVSLVACGLFVLWAMYINSALGAVLVLSAGSFSASLAAPSAYAITIEMGGPHVAAVNATMNMMGNIGALTFPIAVPMLLTQFGNWNTVLLVFAALHVVGAMFWLLLRPDGTILEQSLTASAA